MLVGLLHKARFLLNENSTTILTGVGVGGTVATAVLASRASFKAADVLDEERLIREEAAGEADILEPTRTQKVKLVWKFYIPATGVGIITVTSIIAANKISSRRIAALALASGISERALQEYKEKVVAKLGERQNRTLRDEIAQDRVNENPPGSQVIITGSGEVLCFDMLTGRYFLSTVEAIKRAENKINYEILHHMSASLSEFYDEVGLAPTSYTDSVGWSGEPIEVAISTVMSPDKRPCIAVDFNRPPVLDYSKYYG